ncbi:MAG TPA: sugar ABC transporter ATP-binding protein, partial [Bacillota bacterium]|nr:sugar ABC transporter ATP-binding protein [Bacillota bacterium]
LMKILCGVYGKDCGRINLCGTDVEVRDTKHAEGLGISMIHQEFNLLPFRNVAQNIFLGREPVKGPLKVLDEERMHEESKQLLRSLGMVLDTRTPVKELGVAQRQMVEVAKALSMNAKVLIMDEPTATLTTREIEQLFATIANLTKKGVSIVYISHRMEEIFRIADRITVLRDGLYVATVEDPSGITMDELVAMMVGRRIEKRFEKPPVKLGKEVLRVEGLSSDGKFEDVSLYVREGEIVGISGLVGAGRTEVARAIFGADPKDSGKVSLFGGEIKAGSPGAMVAKGVGFVPEDRKEQGLALIMSVKDNIVQASLDKVSTGPFINGSKEKKVARKYVDELRVATPSVQKLAKFLSGGTQQKVVIAKWLASGSRVLIFDEPTRGIDVGAKQEIYKIMGDLVEEGVGILMISSELPEIISVCDRIYVMHEGRITGEVMQADANQELILGLAMGKEVAG